MLVSQDCVLICDLVPDPYHFGLPDLDSKKLAKIIGNSNKNRPKSSYSLKVTRNTILSIIIIRSY